MTVDEFEALCNEHEINHFIDFLDGMTDDGKEDASD